MMITTSIDYWRKRPNWTLREFSYLLKEVDPRTFDDLDTRTKVQLLMGYLELEKLADTLPELSLFENEDIGDTPINSIKLLRWAEKLDNLEIPGCWIPLLELDPENLRIGSKERENLLATIGALSIALTANTGPLTGDAENPNIRSLAKICSDHTGNAHGMAESTLRERMTEGLKILRDKMNC